MPPPPDRPGCGRPHPRRPDAQGGHGVPVHRLRAGSRGGQRRIRPRRAGQRHVGELYDTEHVPYLPYTRTARNHMRTTLPPCCEAMQCTNVIPELALFQCMQGSTFAQWMRRMGCRGATRCLESCGPSLFTGVASFGACGCVPPRVTCNASLPHHHHPASPCPFLPVALLQKIIEDALAAAHSVADS